MVDSRDVHTKQHGRPWKSRVTQMSNIEPEPRDIPHLVIYCDALNACIRSRLRLQIIQQSALEEKNRQQQ